MEGLEPQSAKTTALLKHGCI